MNSSEPKRVALAELLPQTNIRLELVGVDRAAVLAELVGAIPELADQTEARTKLVTALEEREQLCSTGIGDGIALPHARNALVGLVEEPVLVFGRHRRGLPFGAVDGKPTKIFFLLVAPTVTQHLQVLARLSRVLRNAALRRGLLKAESPADVLELLSVAEQGLGA